MKSRDLNLKALHRQQDLVAAAAEGGAQVFDAEWDDEGVYVYQAFNATIADWALEHQRFGGPAFKPVRMTWVKPSLAWLLYRSGYGHKSNQERLLKVKLSHELVAELLDECQCKEGGMGGPHPASEAKQNAQAPRHKQNPYSGSRGRIQWDPARDLMAVDEKSGKEPRKMLRRRAIQIGLHGDLSARYAAGPISIEDVTGLGQRVGAAHRQKKANLREAAMAALVPELPDERPYMPMCDRDVLVRLALLPGPAADKVATLGKGKAAAAGLQRGAVERSAGGAAGSKKDAVEEGERASTVAAAGRDTAGAAAGDAAAGGAAAGGAAAGGAVLLAEMRPKNVHESVVRSAVAVSKRQQEWGVDGEWSYDFSGLGYACETCSPLKPSATAGPSTAAEEERRKVDPRSPQSGEGGGTEGGSGGTGKTSAWRRCVLRDSFSRVASAGAWPFRVLDLGAGSGGWLLQAQRELGDHLAHVAAPPATHQEEGKGESFSAATADSGSDAGCTGGTGGRGGQFRQAFMPAAAIHLHGITGDANSLPEVGRTGESGGGREGGDGPGSSSSSSTRFQVAHFPQVGFELCPPRLGDGGSDGDGARALKEQRELFARLVGAALAPQGGSGGGGGGGGGCGGGGKVGYDLIVSSWTFCHLVDPLATLELWSGALAVDGELYVNDIDFWVVFEGEEADGSSAGGEEVIGSAFWERDAEGRMLRVFEALNRKGARDGAFAIEFVADEDYRTAVKVKRISSAPIRFSPLIEYRAEDSGDRGRALYVIK